MAADRNRPILPVLAALVPVLALVAALQITAPSRAQGKATTITPANRQEAQQIFAMRCAACHGQTGAGDGPGSAALTPKPRNLQDPKWQKSVTDDYIEKIIVQGGLAVGKSASMPGNPDLASKPGTVAALREHIRGLAKKK